MATQNFSKFGLYQQYQTLADVPAGLPVTAKFYIIDEGYALYEIDSNGTPQPSGGGGGTFQGDWDASTNTPTLVNGTGVNGYYYRVSVAGSVDFGAGLITFAVNDWVAYAGNIWVKKDFSLVATEIQTTAGFTPNANPMAPGLSVEQNLERAAGSKQDKLTESTNYERSIFKPGLDYNTFQPIVEFVDDFKATDIKEGKSISIARPVVAGLTPYELREHLAFYTTTERDAVLTWVAGNIIYNTTTNQIQVYNGTTWTDYKTPGNNTITNAMLAQAGANTYKGNPTGGTADVQDVATNTAFNRNFETNTANLQMDGVASVGNSNNIAHSNHVHPHDTSKFSKTIAGEIAALTAKTGLAAADTTLINDSAATNAVKKATMTEIASYARSTITGGISPYLTTNFNPTRYLRSDGSGKISEISLAATQRLDGFSLLGTTFGGDYLMRDASGGMIASKGPHVVGKFYIANGGSYTTTANDGGYTSERLWYNYAGVGASASISYEWSLNTATGIITSANVIGTFIFDVKFNAVYNSSVYTWGIYNISTGDTIYGANHAYSSGSGNRREGRFKGVVVKTTAVNQRFAIIFPGSWSSSAYNPVGNVLTATNEAMNYCEISRILV